MNHARRIAAIRRELAAVEATATRARRLGAFTSADDAARASMLRHDLRTAIAADAEASQDSQLALDLDNAPAVTVRTVDYSDALPYFDAIRRADSFTL